MSLLAAVLTASLTGVVIDPKTNDPVPDVKVCVVKRCEVTDRRGSFAITGIPASYAWNPSASMEREGWGKGASTVCVDPDRRNDVVLLLGKTEESSDCAPPQRAAAVDVAIEPVLNGQPVQKFSLDVSIRESTDGDERPVPIREWTMNGSAKRLGVLFAKPGVYRIAVSVDSVREEFSLRVTPCDEGELRIAVPMRSRCDARSR